MYYYIFIHDLFFIYIICIDSFHPIIISARIDPLLDIDLFPSTPFLPVLRQSYPRPCNLIMSLTHLAGSLPTGLFASQGRYSLTALVHLPSVSLTKCLPTSTSAPFYIKHACSLSNFHIRNCIDRIRNSFGRYSLGSFASGRSGLVRVRIGKVLCKIFLLCL